MSVDAPAAEPCDILLILEKDELITETARRLCEGFMRVWGVPAIEALIRTNVMPEPEIANALASILKIDRLYHVHSLTLAEESLAVLPFARARAWECLVVKGETGRLGLVSADPLRVDRISEIKQGLKKELTLSVAERSDIVRAIDELYPLSAQLPSLYGAGAAHAPSAKSSKDPK